MKRRKGATSSPDVANPDPQVHQDDPLAPFRRSGPSPLPKAVQTYFSKRKQDSMKILERMERNGETIDPGAMKPSRQADLVVLMAAVAVLFIVLYVEYGVNLVPLVYDWVVSALDPGLPPRDSHSPTSTN